MNMSTLLQVLAVAALLKFVLGLSLTLAWRRRRARQAFELAYHLDPGRQQVHGQQTCDNGALERAKAL